MVFIPNPDKLPEINHKNGIKNDNRVENLEWYTESENQIHASYILEKRIGDTHYDHKLSDEQALEIYELCKEGKMKRVDIGAMYGALDYMNARDRAIEKFNKTGEFQEVGWRSCKNHAQSCRIKPESVTKHGVYHKKIGKQVQSEFFKADAECILKRKNGRYVLSVMVLDVWACDNQASGTVVALDPGIRTFLTWYAGDSCGKIGEQDFNRIYRLCKELDSLTSRLNLSRNHRQRRAMKKASDRLRNRINDLITELHKKSALFLVSNFDVILLPTFETKQMTERTKRKISSKSARSLLTFSHFRFKRFLKHKALQQGKVVVDVNEAYTSKTVSWTGEIKQIGSAKFISSGFGCNKVVVDRDYNGARGIMLRALRASSLKVV